MRLLHFMREILENPRIHGEIIIQTPKERRTLFASIRNNFIFRGCYGSSLSAKNGAFPKKLRPPGTAFAKAIEAKKITGPIGVRLVWPERKPVYVHSALGAFPAPSAAVGIAGVVHNPLSAHLIVEIVHF